MVNLTLETRVRYPLYIVIYCKAVAIDTNLLVAIRATDLLLTPTQSRDRINWRQVLWHGRVYTASVQGSRSSYVRLSSSTWYALPT